MTTGQDVSQPSFEDEAPGGGVGQVLLVVSRCFALAGGALLSLVVVITTISVAGRYLFNTPIPGDYELVEIGCGVAILLFFPYCEMTYGNIKAEFFTDKLPYRIRAALNIFSEVLFVGVASLLTWRFVVGGLRRLADGQAYMHLEIPIWWAYIPGSIAMGLLVLVCLWRAVDTFTTIASGDRK